MFIKETVKKISRDLKTSTKVPFLLKSRFYGAIDITIVELLLSLKREACSFDKLVKTYILLMKTELACHLSGSFGMPLKTQQKHTVELSFLEKGWRGTKIARQFRSL